MVTGLSWVRADGPAAVVTGSSSGIGLAAARALSSAGARVAIAGRDEARLASAAGSLNGDALTVAADLSSQAGAAVMCEAAGASVILTSSASHDRGFAAGQDLLGRQIRVNTVSFGAVSTPPPT